MWRGYINFLIGDRRTFLLEQRLFHTVNLLNGAANLGGAFVLPDKASQEVLFILHLATAALFFLIYGLGRSGRDYRPLYWPFVLGMLGFLVINILGNAGSMGGAHYYLIVAVVVAVFVAPGLRAAGLALGLFLAATAALLLAERQHPDWFVQHPSKDLRWGDVTQNLLFVEVFLGTVVLILARSLQNERSRSDRLLLNILPPSVAEELKSNDSVEPRYYDSATVFFSDTVGFTRIAEQLSADELIDRLDKTFTIFDTVMEKYGIEKIKTIGDAYMAASGVPEPSPAHAVEMVLAALTIQDKFRSCQEGEEAVHLCWEHRMGIHTGPLYAGVIGTRKFAYDIWGDTVNVAARLEQAGAAGRVNISRETYEQVNSFFTCSSRGQIPAKNKGEIEMYFVDGIRPELSVDGAGREPNSTFWEVYKRFDD